MRLTWLWFGMALLMLPASVAAQHSRGERSKGLNGAVEKLFGYSEELGLTSDQLVRLQTIKDSADAQNRPSWRRIMAVRREIKARQAAEPDMSAEEKSALLEQSGAEIHRLYDQIKSNEHSAMRAVGNILTPEQKEVLLKIIKRNGDDDKHRRDSRGRGNGRG